MIKSTTMDMLMRQVLFSCLALLLLLAFAKNTAQAQLIRGWGGKVGLTLSNVKLDPSFDTVYRHGIAGFGYVEWLQVPGFSVVTEVGYVPRGFATEHEKRDAANMPDGTFRQYFRFDYVSTAILAKLRFERSGIAPYVAAGPRVDFYLGGDPSGTGSLAGAYSSMAYGLTTGIGVESSRLLSVTLFGELRFNYDVTNSTPDVPRDSYNRAFDLMVGTRF